MSIQCKNMTKIKPKEHLTSKETSFFHHTFQKIRCFHFYGFSRYSRFFVAKRPKMACNGKNKWSAVEDKCTFMGPKMTFSMRLGSLFQKMTLSQKRSFWPIFRYFHPFSLCMGKTSHSPFANAITRTKNNEKSK